MPELTKTPPGLRAALAHGLDLPGLSGAEHYGDCPFCGREGKFYVNASSGLWSCKSASCGEKGNPLTLARRLWEVSHGRTTDADYAELAGERGLLYPGTPASWGCAKSIVTGVWLVPGYSPDGQVSQVYRLTPLKKNDTWHKVLLPTPGLGGDSGVRHGVYGLKLFDPKEHEMVWVCEGPWDGMALWEVLDATQEKGIAVVAVPGCKVFADPWSTLFKGKKVVLLFDSDHPRTNNGRVMLPEGYAGMKRVAGLLNGCTEPPASVEYLRWGDGGYDPDLPDGYDVRDRLKDSDHLRGRESFLRELFAKIRPVPDTWEVLRGGGLTKVSASECHDYGTVVRAWEKAIRWRQELQDVLAVMLAVALSTEQTGNQLFLQVIGDAGSGKTCFCEAMLVSKFCYPLEHLSGFHSGYTDKDGSDYSLLSRINHKTIITPEGDVLVSSPRFTEIMSQQRRIFDGTSGASYKNRKEDQRYTGLRTPWIMAGTPALLDADQSRLGDRFLRVRVWQPDEAEKQAILVRVAMSAFDSVVRSSNGSASSSMSPNMARAYKLTGGYVDHLRNNSQLLLNKVAKGSDPVALGTRCATLAEFTAYMRARPHQDHRKDTEATKELPTRLTHQFTRLAVCLGAVTGELSVTEGVLGVVKKVALDTAHGPSLEVARHLHKVGDGGATLGQLSAWTGHSEDHEARYLRFMRQVGAVERFQKRRKGWSRPTVHYRLTERVRELCDAVIGNGGGK